MYVDVMPSIEDVMVLFVVPFLEYILYPHMRRSMGIEVRPIHKVLITTILNQLRAGLVFITLSSLCVHMYINFSFFFDTLQGQ